MGKTVKSSRIALEEEINRWDGFARALRKDDKEAFDELRDMYGSFVSESSNATNPAIFEPSQHWQCHPQISFLSRFPKNSFFRSLLP